MFVWHKVDGGKSWRAFFEADVDENILGFSTKMDLQNKKKLGPNEKQLEVMGHIISRAAKPFSVFRNISILFGTKSIKMVVEMAMF